VGLEAATVLSDELDRNATLREQPRPLTSWPQILKEVFSKRHIRGRRILLINQQGRRPLFVSKSCFSFDFSGF